MIRRFTHRAVGRIGAAVARIAAHRRDIVMAKNCRHCERIGRHAVTQITF